jgi:hypothetical protein
MQVLLINRAAARDFVEIGCGISEARAVFRVNGCWGGGNGGCAIKHSIVR